MKRIALALVVAAVLFGAVYASAAALNVDGGVIQHGEDDYLKCTEALVVDGWGLETDDNTVRSVRFQELPDECNGAEAFVRIHLDGGGNVASHWTVTDGMHSISFSPYLTPDEIIGVEAWIEGPGG